MLDSIRLLDMASKISLSNNSNGCSCNSNRNGFDLILMGILKAVAKTNQMANITNEIDKSIANINNANDGLQTINTIQNINRIKPTSKDEDTNRRIENAVNSASRKYGIDSNLIKSIIKVESDFNPNCVSSAGAKGLMQLMPFNCDDLGVTDPFNIEQNIDGGTRHIKEYLDKYNGDTEMALMAYNGGPTRMKNRGVNSINDIYKMPKETQNYVPKVMKYYKGY